MRCNDLPLELFEKNLKNKPPNTGAPKVIPINIVLNGSEDDDIEDIVTYHPSNMTKGRGGETDGTDVIEEESQRKKETDDTDVTQKHYDESSDDSTVLGFNSEEEEPVRKSCRTRAPRRVFTYHKVGGKPVIE